MAETRAPLRLRDHLADLEALGWLRNVDRPVDRDWEIACIARFAAESTSEDDAYAIRFKRVRGFDVPVVVGLFASRRLIARSLGVAPGAIWERWAEALSQPLKPEVVARGLAKQCVLAGDAADLGRFPVPIWTPGRDTHPYIPTACVVTAERTSRVQNIGTYRVQVQGARRLGLFFGSEKQHGAMHRKSWEERGEPMPVAFVIGAAPAVSYAAAAKLRYGVDEIDVAGGLAGCPIPVVRCESHDLVVPADAEIVIEGFARPGERADEGPFGEALGYMEGVAPASVVDVTCITHRAEPVLHGLVQQLPPSEGHLLMEMGLVGSLWHYLTRRARAAGLVDLAIVPGAAGTSVICASVRAGDRESVAAVVRAMRLLNWGQKLVIVVDDDVDVRDPTTLFWAVSSRVDFERDVTVQGDVDFFQRDPAAFARSGDATAPGQIPLGSKMIIDATVKRDCMDVALPSRALMRRVRETWESTGLPALRSTLRLDRLLDSRGEGGIEYHLPSHP